MYDEVADRFLSLFFLHQRVVAAEKFHCESIVGDVEHGSQLIAQIDGRRICRCFVPRLRYLQRWNKTCVKVRKKKVKVDVFLYLKK